MLPEGEHVKSVSWCRSDFLCKLNAAKSEKENRTEVSEPKDPNLHSNGRFLIFCKLPVYYTMAEHKDD